MMREDINEAILVGALKAVQREASNLIGTYLTDDSTLKQTRDAMMNLIDNAKTMIELLSTLDDEEEGASQSG